jgi:transposase
MGNASPTLAFLRGIDFGWLGMVWGGIYHGLKSPLIVIADNLTDVGYRDEILRPVAVPFVQQHHLILQQDNARPHVTRVCQDFLTNHNINPLDWPLYSPDLSPIEHLWDEMDRRVRGRQNAPATLDQLRAVLLEEWDNIHHEKDKCSDELHAQENQGSNRCARGAYEILTS